MTSYNLNNKVDPAAAKYAVVSMINLIKKYNSKKKYDYIIKDEFEWINSKNNSNKKKDVLYAFYKTQAGNDKNKGVPYNFIVHASNLEITKRFFKKINQSYGTGEKYQSIDALYELFSKIKKELRVEIEKEEKELEIAKKAIDEIKAILDNRSIYLFPQDKYIKYLNQGKVNKIEDLCKQTINSIESIVVEKKFSISLNEAINNLIKNNVKGYGFLNVYFEYSKINSSDIDKIQTRYLSVKSFKNTKADGREILLYAIDKIYVLNWLSLFFNTHRFLNKNLGNKKINKDEFIRKTYKITNNKLVDKLSNGFLNYRPQYMLKDKPNSIPNINWSQYNDKFFKNIRPELMQIQKVDSPDAGSAYEDYHGYIHQYFTPSGSILQIYDKKLKYKRSFNQNINDFIDFNNFMLDRLSKYGDTAVGVPDEEEKIEDNLPQDQSSKENYGIKIEKFEVISEQKNKRYVYYTYKGNKFRYGFNSPRNYNYLKKWFDKKQKISNKSQNILRVISERSDDLILKNKKKNTTQHKQDNYIIKLLNPDVVSTKEPDSSSSKKKSKSVKTKTQTKRSIENSTNYLKNFKNVQFLDI